MRIAVLTVEAKENTGSLSALVAELAEGMRAMGHQVDTYSASDNAGPRLPGYDYIAVCSEPLSAFSSKLPPRLSQTLAQASSLVGKRSGAFLRKRGLFSAKAMATLMKAMEKEGMIVNWSDFLLSSAQALVLGKGIGA